MSRSDPDAFRKMCFMLAQWIEAPKNQTELAVLLNTTIDEYHKTHPEITVSKTLVEVSPGFAQPMLKTFLPQDQTKTAKTEFEYVVISKPPEDPQSQKRFSPIRPSSAASAKSAGSEKKSEKIFEEAKSQQSSPVASHSSKDGWVDNDDALVPTSPLASSKNFHRAPASSVRSSHANLARQSVAVSKRSQSPICSVVGIDAVNVQYAFKKILNDGQYWPKKSMQNYIWAPAPTLAVYIIQALVKKLHGIADPVLGDDGANVTSDFSRKDLKVICPETELPINCARATEIWNSISTVSVKLTPNKAAVFA